MSFTDTDGIFPCLDCGGREGAWVGSSSNAAWQNLAGVQVYIWFLQQRFFLNVTGIFLLILLFNTLL